MSFQANTTPYRTEKTSYRAETTSYKAETTFLFYIIYVRRILKNDKKEVFNFHAWTRRILTKRHYIMLAEDTHWRTI